jgi:hypothetical protein
MIAAPDFMAAPDSLEDLMVFDPEFSEMDMATTSNYNETAPPASLGFTDCMDFAFDDPQEFPGAESYDSMSNLLEATFAPRYLSTTAWYQSNNHV